MPFAPLQIWIREMIVSELEPFEDFTGRYSNAIRGRPLTGFLVGQCVQ